MDVPLYDRLIFHIFAWLSLNVITPLHMMSVMKDLLNEATVEELRAVFLMATLDFCGIISQLLLAGSHQ